ncbi:MAG: Fur family transcriptional regulator, partial [Clostridia bacterium]
SPLPHVSAGDIAAHLRSVESSVGTATVYRQLDKMVEAGLVRKYSLDGGACYQYVGGGQGCREHFHLKCLKCGALIHVDCEFLSGLAPHILEHHGFEVDNSRTVMYGICRECRGENE